MRSWTEQLMPIINEYKDGDDEPLDGDSVDALCEIIKAKINLIEGNITESEYESMLDGRVNVCHTKYALFGYLNNPSPSDKFKLGDVVYNRGQNSIGVIIQCHGTDEYRTDQFGNCSVNEIEAASHEKILELRPFLYEQQ